MKRVAVANLGCKVNRCDLLSVGAGLDPALVALVRHDEDADLYVVNSCTVTHASGAQSLKLARQIARRHPGRPIVFTGCHATISPEQAEELEAVVRVVDNPGKVDLPVLIAELLEMPRAALETPRPLAPLDGFTRPVLKVQDGCDQRCSYCIIPDARGPSRSQAVDWVVAQVQALADQACPEVVLTGIHLGDYGKGLAEPVDLTGLVEALLERTQGTRIRLSSIEPMEITARLRELVAQHPRICRHLHIPVQSGSSRILAAMRRPYDRGQVQQALAAVLAASPDIAVGVDLIVGFPGESEAEHQATVELIEALEIAYLHVFPFSARPGTPAVELPGRLPEREVKLRGARLRELSDVKRQAFHRRQLGRTVDMVVERRHSEPGWVRGTSDHYLDLIVAAEAAPGGLLRVVPRELGTPLRAELADVEKGATTA